MKKYIGAIILGVVLGGILLYVQRDKPEEPKPESPVERKAAPKAEEQPTPKPDEKTEEAEPAAEVEDEGPGTDAPPAQPPKTSTIESQIGDRFPLKGISYKSESWKDGNTGKTELIIIMEATDAKMDDAIHSSFAKGDALVSDKQVMEMQRTAEMIISEVPKMDAAYHVEQVVWQKQGDASTRIRLSHDFERSTMQ